MDLPPGRFARIPVPNAALSKAERVVREELAEIDARYRREAEPFMNKLAEIEAMREYEHVFIPE